MLPLALIPIMGVLNRASGMDEWFPGRNIYATTILTGLVVGFITMNWYFGVLAFLAFAAYRLPGWYTWADIGTVKGNPIAETIFLSVRTMVIGIPLIFAFPTLTTLYALVAVGLSCGLSYAFALHGPIKLKDRNALAEVLAGLVIGGFFAFIFG